MALVMKTQTAHENCERCEDFREGSIEALIQYKEKKECSFSGYGGQTPDGENHHFLVKWEEE
jgi:hypothetical protein